MTDEELIPVHIPPLVQLLQALESRKGLPLSRDEVEQVCGKAVCMMMRVSAAEAMAKSRGFRDIDPANAWEEWVAYRERSVDN